MSQATDPPFPRENDQFKERDKGNSVVTVIGIFDITKSVLYDLKAGKHLFCNITKPTRSICEFGLALIDRNKQRRTLFSRVHCLYHVTVIILNSNVL